MMVFRDKPNFYRVVEIEEEKNGKFITHKGLADEQGYLYSREEVNDLINTIKDFYSLNNNHEIIDTLNIQEKLKDYLDMLEGLDKLEIVKSDNGKYNIPHVNYKYKEFNPNKRNWSFQCGWCGTRVSSKIDKSYYSLHSNGLGISMERGCSINCINLIWKDEFKKWINSNGFNNYFNM